MNVIKISGKGIYYTLYGLLLALNYAVEGVLMYGVYWLINHWWTTGEEMFWWIIGGFFLMFVRMALPHAGEPADDEYRDKMFNFHEYMIWRTILTIGYLLSKIPLRFEIKDD